MNANKMFICFFLAGVCCFDQAAFGERKHWYASEDEAIAYSATADLAHQAVSAKGDLKKTGGVRVNKPKKDGENSTEKFDFRKGLKSVNVKANNLKTNTAKPETVDFGVRLKPVRK